MLTRLPIRYSPKHQAPRLLKHFSISHSSSPSNSRLTLSAATPEKSHQTKNLVSVSYAGQRHSAASIPILAVLIGGVVFSGSFLLYSQLNDSTSEVVKIKQAMSEDQVVMVRPVPPGRPGNLTADEDAKLKELWKSAFTLFGLSLHDTTGNSSSVDATLTRDNQDDAAGPLNAISQENKKKKRLTLFGKKKVDSKDTREDKASISTIPEVEDKHGQTKEFHQALDDMSAGDLRQAFWNMVKHDHPDGLLLRFLRARKWDVEKAVLMMISTMRWRLQEMHVDDDILPKGEQAALENSKSPDSIIKKEGEDFMTQLRMGKCFLHGSDNDGRPICFVRVRLHHQGDQSESSIERVTVLNMEEARLLLSPPVDTAAVLFDMTGFSMANMDYGPVKFLIRCFEANYPESLGVVLVHKAPWVFQGVYKLIKTWLDPVVAAKVKFTNNIDDLEQYIPRKHIAKELGGDDPWTYHYIEPQPDENEKMANEAVKQRLLAERAAVVEEFEVISKQWLKMPYNETTFTEKRNELVEKLRIGYWELDPYIRARTLYDRCGVIKPGGQIDYDGIKNDHSNAPPITGDSPDRKVVFTNGPTPANHDPSSLG